VCVCVCLCVCQDVNVVVFLPVIAVRERGEEDVSGHAWSVTVCVSWLAVCVYVSRLAVCVCVCQVVKVAVYK
jgi:hypothetical protein